MGLGERLKELRKKKGLTQNEVAEKLGIDFTTISKYENNRSEPDFETIKKLARIYDVPLHLLILGDDRKEGDDSIDVPDEIYAAALLGLDEDDLELLHIIKKLTPEQQENFKRLVLAFLGDDASNEK